MNKRTAALLQSLVVLALFVVPSAAQDEEALKKAESDYAVSGKDGHLYRVYLNAAGRVVAETRKWPR